MSTIVYGWGRSSILPRKEYTKEFPNETIVPTPCLIEELSYKNIEKLSSCTGALVYITKDGRIGQIGAMVYAPFEKNDLSGIQHLRFCDVALGACTYCLAVTDNGDVYSWGCKYLVKFVRILTNLI
jgi:alpha-tubulin suppressor-like RCC1 family protein